jgi:hypothetical protein
VEAGCRPNPSRIDSKRPSGFGPAPVPGVVPIRSRGFVVLLVALALITAPARAEECDTGFLTAQKEDQTQTHWQKLKHAEQRCKCKNITATGSVENVGTWGERSLSIGGSDGLKYDVFLSPNHQCGDLARINRGRSITINGTIRQAYYHLMQITLEDATCPSIERSTNVGGEREPGRRPTEAGGGRMEAGATSAHAIVLCTTPDGKTYAGNQPPPDCTERSRFKEDPSSGGGELHPRRGSTFPVGPSGSFGSQTPGYSSTCIGVSFGAAK